MFNFENLIEEITKKLKSVNIPRELARIQISAVLYAKYIELDTNDQKRIAAGRAVRDSIVLLDELEKRGGK